MVWRERRRHGPSALRDNPTADHVENAISALSMHPANFGRSIFQSFGGVFPTGSSIERSHIFETRSHIRMI
jgi:hypothetical protein